MYEGLANSADAAAFLQQLNAQGARGFRFVSGYIAPPDDSIEAYVKDADTTYTYELQPEATTLADYEQQLNGQGAKGFTWGGSYAIGTTVFALYRKDNSSSATYTYKALPAATTSAAFLAQVNEQGAGGFYSLSPAYQVGDTSVSFYRKNTQSAATYGYEVLDSPGSADDFYAQLNAQGAKGLRFRTEFAFNGEAPKTIYEKDLSQAATFAFFGGPVPKSSADFIAFANTEGAKGNGLVGPYQLPGGVGATLYYTPGSCSGFLCDVRNLFGL